MNSTCPMWIYQNLPGVQKLTSAVSIMADSYGSTQKTGSPTQVAGAWVSDVIVATDGLLSDHGHWAGCSAAHDAVGTVGLVRHAGMCSRTYDIWAGLWKNSVKNQENYGKKIIFRRCNMQLTTRVQTTFYTIWPKNITKQKANVCA